MSTSLRLLGDPPASVKAVPAFVAKGFRPFFLAAGAFAALILPVWILALAGRVRVDGYLDPTYWHAHEMVFGFAVAVIAGFLLTAVGNWTARETAIGAPLAALAALWVLGRVAFAAAAALPKGAVAALDLAFLPALWLTIARPILATKNARNYPVLAMVGMLFLANLATHLDALGVIEGWRRRASLFAVDLVTLLIVFLAARIFPMFTRNATRVESVRNVPALDWATTISMAALAIADLALPDRALGPILAGITAALAIARSVTWGAQHSLKIPLLWILHVGHGFVIVGLALRAASALTNAVPPSSALHALTAGAIGCTTLGMMARVALGHTGRPLVAPKAATVAFVLVTLAALARTFGTMSLAAYKPSLHASGTLFAAGFAVFAVSYAKVLTRPRVDGKPG